MIFTFGEGEMPEYLKLCMSTGKQPYIVLTYDNVNEYTNLPLDKIKGRWTLPVIADIVRVHVLRDRGGYWLDTDTIMLGDLPTENMVGYLNDRSNTIGYLYTEPHSEMYTKWAEYQDKIINSDSKSTLGSLMGNSFTDDYLKKHLEISIYPLDNLWPEVYMIKENINRYNKYRKFYFEKKYQLKDINKDKLLMLHNSGTPDGYKKLSREEIFNHDCTISNILKELCKNKN